MWMKTCQYYNDKQKTENSGMGRPEEDDFLTKLYSFDVKWYGFNYTITWV